MRRQKKQFNPVQKIGAANDTGNTRKIHTRFGDVIETYGEWSGNYQKIYFEGTPRAVIWLVGQRCEATSTCYENTFTVEHVEIIELKDSPFWGQTGQRLKVTCEWTSYVGD